MKAFLIVGYCLLFFTPINLMALEWKAHTEDLPLPKGMVTFTNGSEPYGICTIPQKGHRIFREGRCGEDVKTANQNYYLLVGEKYRWLKTDSASLKQDLKSHTAVFDKAPGFGILCRIFSWPYPHNVLING